MKGFLTVLLVLCAASSLAQTDAQVRILAHKQVAKPGFGIVGWVVASDVTEKPEALPVPARSQRGLVVAGLGYKWKSAWGVNWAELMPGTFVIEGQKPDHVLDLRTSFAFPKGLALGVEGLRAFRSNRNMLISRLTVPVPGTKGRLRVGVESDLIWKQGPDSKGAGPCVTWKTNEHVNLGLGFQWRTGVEPNFGRSYNLFSF